MELSDDDLYYSKNLTKLPIKTVHTYQEKSQLPHGEGSKINPNSAIQCYFQGGEKTYAKSALFQVLVELIREPAFNTLRTQEQLGYIVKVTYSSSAKVIGLNIKIQSARYGADYLEHRINNFIENLPNFSEEQVENIKRSLIKEYEQVITNIGQEGLRFWSQLEDDCFEFDSIPRAIRAI